MSDVLPRNIAEKPFNRRNFVKSAGATGLGIAAMTMLGSGLGKLHAATSTITDADIINFALNLEYLEAEFYSVASRGHTLVERGIIARTFSVCPLNPLDQLSAV